MGPETICRVSRYLLPALAGLVLFRAALSLLFGRSEREVWGWLTLPNRAKLPLTGWENILGRSRSSDAVLPYKTVARTHCALTRDAGGRWTVRPIGSAPVKVGGRTASGPVEVQTGDILQLGPVKAVFTGATLSQERAQAERRTRPGRRVNPTVTVLLLTGYEVTLGAALCLSFGGKPPLAVPLSYLVLLVTQWFCYFLTRSLGRVGFELETLAFLLTATGLSVAAGSDPGGLWRQTLSVVLGAALFWCLGWLLRDLDRVRKLRIPMAASGLALLAASLLLSETVFGAKNWLYIGPVSLQPSELAKICFVFAGAATLDKLYTRRSLWLFIGFAAAAVGCLALMRDLGTAVVFFAAYLVIAFLRSGSFATVLLSAAGAGYAAVIAASALPYVGERFASFGKAWEFYNDGGYQQTRTMAASASGGLFGLGAGRGWFKNVFAADTDMVFGVLSEELGLWLAATAVLTVLTMTVFAVKAAGNARSAFYAIGACAASTMMTVQMLLNVFGSLDMLPFTGVTFPFVSRGGTSMLASWGLLAFLKAADTRQNGSFTVPLPAVEETSRRGNNAAKTSVKRTEASKRPKKEARR